MEINSKCEIAPVALIFFNRPKTLQKVFDEVKKVKPSKLFLIQDGLRSDKPEDSDKIAKCKEIVNQIDWKCDVHKNYSNKNLGCGLRPYTGIDWVFSQVDRAIILEDDCVPSESFFYYCSEMLERYCLDQRIFLITGCNFELETKNCNDSYFFGYSGTNWGWASWRRCWEHMDYNLEFVNDQNTVKLLADKLRMICGKKGLKELDEFIKTNRRIKNGENISYWDVQWQAVRYLHNQLSIIPAKNLITNIGTGEESTHAKDISENITKDTGLISFFYNQRYELDFPLKHPKYIIQNVEYDKKIDRRIYANIFKRVILKLLRTFGMIKF